MSSADSVDMISDAWFLSESLVDVMFQIAAIQMSFSSCILNGRISANPRDLHAVFVPVTSLILQHSNCGVSIGIVHACDVCAKVSGSVSTNSGTTQLLHCDSIIDRQ